MMTQSTSKAYVLSMPTYSLRWLFLIVLLVFASDVAFSQVVIARQDFETTPATPTLTFTTANIGTPGTSTGFSTGTSGTSAAPSNANLFSEGARGYRIQGPDTGTTTAGRTLTFASVNTSAYTNVSLSFRVAGMSIGTTGNGMEATIDEVLVEVSPDNGTTWYQQAKVNCTGAGSNARWAFTGTGSGSRSYAANNTFSSFSVTNTNTAGATITGAAAITTATVTGLPQVANLLVRISAQTNSVNESWIIDDVRITGTLAATTDFCNIQFPTSATIGEGETVAVYAQAYEPGLTEAAGAGSGLSAWIGYSATNSDPSLGGWTWVAATFNTQSGNNDEFVANLGSGLAIGTYYYASRFQINSGPYTYGGTAGNWSSTANNGVLTVTSNLVDFANIQSPTSGSVTEGGTFNVYARVYEPGVTVPAGASANITAWIGVNASNTNPNTWTTWIPATFNAQFGNDDEYFANIASGLTPGTYYYASRFQKTGSTEYSYGGVGGLWSNNSGVLTVNPDVVDYANIQFPASGSVPEGGTLNVYIQAYEPSYTEAGGANAGLTAELGYSSTNSNPNGTGWTWIATTYNTQSGNNDEYVANIAAGLTPGTYYYASRFKKSTSTYYQYGGTNGVWNNDNGVLTITAATPVVSSGSPTGTVGIAFSYSIVVSNSPTSFAVSLGTLPSGLTLNTTTGQITGTPTAAGTFVVSVTASNAAGTSTPATLTFTIAQGSQTITFGALANATYGDAPIALTATASSGLTVSYSSSNTNVATVSGATLTIVGVGTTTITASQAGDANYTAATSVNQSFTVGTKGLTISGITANDKVQDGTTTATLAGIATLVGVVSGDELLVSLSGTPIANFATALPGANQVVTVSGYSLSGIKAGNYTVAQPIGLTASITALNIPVATADTNATATSFDANWNAVTGASGYQLDVYQETITFTPGLSVLNNSGTLGASGWTETATQGTNSGNSYYQLLTSTSVLISPAMDFSNLSNKSLVFKARTFGGPSTAEATITVSISTNNGSSWTTLGTRVPGSTTLTNQAVFDLNSYTGTQVKIRLQTLGAAGGRGVGVDDIILTADQTIVNQTFLSGYNPMVLGAVTSTTVTGITSCTQYKYRVRAINGSIVTANSNVITVEAVSIGGTATGDQTICEGTQPAALNVSGQCGSIVKWQSASDALFTTPVDIASTATTLSGATIGNLTATTYFRAVVQNGARPVAYSNAVTVTVTPSTVASVAIVSTATTICLGTSVTFTATPTNGGTTPSYQWKVNGNNVGTDSPIYTTTALAHNDVVTVVMTSNATPCLVGSPATSNAITITVNALGTATISGTNGPALCPGSDVTFTVTGTADAIVYYNLNGGSTAFTVLTGGSATITVAGATSTQTLNLVSVDNGLCPVTLSETATVTLETTTWNGTTWSHGAPTATVAAVIAGNMTITSNIEACSLTVNNNAAVSVASGYNVTLQNALTVASGSSFTVNSNANLIQVNPAAVNSGAIVVKRTTNPLMRLDYVLWGSPVAGQNLFNFSPLTSVSPSIRFYTYTTAINFYNGVTDYATHTMQTGKGYLIRLPFNHPTAPATWTGSFTGVPNNGTQTVTLANNGAGFRYNAVSNPYPSTLDMAQFYADNSNAIEPTLYFWRKTNSSANPSYCSYNLFTNSYVDNNQAYTENPNGVIQVGQGFFVEAKDSSTSVEFNNTQRIGNNANQMFRTAGVTTQSIERNRIWLNLTGTAGEFSQTMVGYFTGGTLAADVTDAKFFNDGTTALHTKINGEAYSMNGRPVPFDATDIVPLTYKVATAGTFSITIGQKDGLFADTALNQIIYLKDNETNTYHNLNDGAYSFSTQAGTFDSRFELVYQNALSNENPTLDASAFAVVKSNGKVRVQATTNLETVRIYDLHGRLLTQVTHVNAQELTLPVQVADQVLMVQVLTTDQRMGVKKAL